jgi:uncharacterized protein YbjT (DUF2867 family)
MPARTVVRSRTSPVPLWECAHAGTWDARFPCMATTKKRSKTILITGATGNQGGASLRHLRESGFAVRALVRNPDQPQARTLAGPGVELVQGDMDDRNSLVRALDGAYGVHSVQSTRQDGAENETRQGINVADAAKTSGITHFVYSSVASADQHTGIPHFESKFRVEERIRATGMHFTIVRPVFFMENWLAMRETIENGALKLPLDPSTRLQMIAVDNIGGLVADVFAHPGKWQNRIFELAGDELSMQDLAQVFTRASGREVRYVQVPWDEFEKQAGPEITTMYHWFQNVGYHVDLGAVRQEYHNVMSFEQWINSYWHTSTRTAR